MGALTRIARGAAGVLAVAAYQIGAHHAAATPGAHGFGLAMAIVPLLAIALARRCDRRIAPGCCRCGRSPARRCGWRVHRWRAISNGACISSTSAST